MSRPRLRQKYGRRLLMEALEDRRVLTGLALGASALVELTIAVPAPAHVAELEQAAHVTVAVHSETQAEATGAPSKAAAQMVHKQIVELHHEYQVARHELVDDFKEARAELREEHHDLRAETSLATPADRVEFNAAANDARVELKQELHEELVELREDFRDARTEIISKINDQLPPGGSDDRDDMGNEPIQNIGHEIRDNLEVVPRLNDSANDPLNQVNPATPDGLVAHNDRIVPPDADRDALPPDALTENQHAPAAVLQDGPIVRSTTARSELASLPAIAGSTDVPLASGSVGNVEEEEIRPVALVIAGTDSEADADLQGAGLAAGDSSLSTASLDAALQQILQGADQVARALTQNPGFLPWMLAALAGGVGLEFYRRKKKAVRATLAAASLTSNSTLSWVPGMPGSFSDEDA